MKVSSTFFQIVLIFLGNILLSKCQTNHLPIQMLRIFNRAFIFEWVKTLQSIRVHFPRRSHLIESSRKNNGIRLKRFDDLSSQRM